MWRDCRGESTGSEAEQAAVRELVKAARARGEDLTGPDGLLKSITATVLETALEEELTLLIQAGATPVEVQRILGHSTPATTLNLYTHLLPDALDGAI